MTTQEAEQYVEADLHRRFGKEGTNYAVVMPKHTKTFPWGWLLYWNGKEFYELGDVDKGYYGNVPILLDRNDRTMTHINGLDADDFRSSTLVRQYAESKGYVWKSEWVAWIDGYE